MPTNYRRPGVYLEESILSGSGDIGTSSAVAVFVGAANKGPTADPVRIESWTDYVTIFGGFDPAGPVEAPAQTAYLPYAVYSYFQNGGRIAYVQRAISSGGAAATFDVTDGSSDTAFTVTANSTGTWGNSLALGIAVQSGSTVDNMVYTLGVYRLISAGNYSEIERFTNISVSGLIPGTKLVTDAVNDSVYGSAYITISDLDKTVTPDAALTPASAALIGGDDGDLPASGDLSSAATAAVNLVEGSILLNIASHLDSTGTWVGTSLNGDTFSERGNVFVINDAAPQRAAAVTSANYITGTLNSAPLTQADTSSSYSASYTPWIVVPNPAVNGGTITVPPGGAVMGVIARTDATAGPFRAPAGMLAGISNAINVDAKFSDTALGDLNSRNINVIRPVTGAGIAIMGARTRKSYGTDRYISARRTLIYIKESLKASTQFAVFENNDQRLWNRLTSTADRILRPVWSSGGLRGASAAEAYFIICDSTINTPAVISSGEVRMEIGVALEYPAEFIVIRLSQFENGGASATVI